MYWMEVITPTGMGNFGGTFYYEGYDFNQLIIEKFSSLIFVHLTVVRLFISSFSSDNLEAYASNKAC